MREFVINVNGFEVCAKYLARDIDIILMPLIARLMDLRRNKGRRICAFLAGAPGSGKSTLALTLERLALDTRAPYTVQALGLDGFHYPNAYLKERVELINGEHTRLIDVKGRPETFDTRRFSETLKRALTSGGEWQLYDRTLHEPVGVQSVSGDILLIEGNWLLLADDAWKRARALCDISIMLKLSDEALLKKRLTERKMRGGLSADKALEWYARVDKPNCALFTNNSAAPDVTISLSAFQ